ncbi:RIO1 family regulatory kinase/ATPase [Rodentibacter caecimuris]|uniref:non-specific serine/threonine protein kinase n=1 Tax=Rodentibacter caecimuris TaxID=1796644 RepID=A0ABX3KZC0_9PAST|nr:hypothetical protein BKG89_03395 [Rodentibacter heylii]
MNDLFKTQVEALRSRHQGIRVFSFEFEGKRFWLKQPEKLRGVECLLKPNPKKAFAEELHILQELMKRQAPVPNVVCIGQDYFVTEDVGLTSSQLCDLKNITDEQRIQILSDCAVALISLHQQGIVHGRPAMRDIAWQDGVVKFMDFESRSKSHNQNWLISRDMLVFLHSLCREKSVSDNVLQQVFNFYRMNCPKSYWENMLDYVYKLRWVYYLLLPFKPIAKKDLVAVYRLFEQLKPL